MTRPVTKKSEPVRTCVGCRQRRPAQVLMRIRLHDDVLVGDIAAANVGGRSAWLCRETLHSCLKNAANSRAFDRAFRRGVPAGVVDAFVDRFPAAESG